MTDNHETSPPKTKIRIEKRGPKKSKEQIRRDQLARRSGLRNKVYAGMRQPSNKQADLLADKAAAALGHLKMLDTPAKRRTKNRKKREERDEIIKKRRQLYPGGVKAAAITRANTSVMLGDDPVE